MTIDEMNMHNRIVLENENLRNKIYHLEKENNSWIPCDEGLPNDEEMHYVTLYNGKVDSAWYDECSEKWFRIANASFEDIFESIRVIAWQPLPESYDIHQIKIKF